MANMDMLLQIAAEQERHLLRLAEEQHQVMGRSLRVAFSVLQQQARQAKPTWMQEEVHSSTLPTSQPCIAEESDPLPPEVQFEAVKEVLAELKIEPEKIAEPVLETVGSISAASAPDVSWWSRIAWRLELAFGWIVLLNLAALFLELEVYGADFHAPPDALYSAFLALEGAFDAAFLAEFLAKIFALRIGFFLMGRNVLDAFLALLGALDLVLLAVGERPAVGARAQQGRRERRQLGLAARELFWCLAMLGVLLYSGALMLGNLIQLFISDEAAALEDRLWVWANYGTGLRSVTAFLDVPFGGMQRLLVEKVSPGWISIFFLVYMALWAWLWLRIAAVFFHEALWRLDERRQAMQTLEEALRSGSDNGHAELTEERLREVCAQHHQSFAALGMDTQEAKVLFQLLAGEEAELESSELLRALRLGSSGPLLTELKRLDHKVSLLVEQEATQRLGLTPKRSR
ncbi:unnamed protein product [Effrenium voratum]|uniref:Uncharacterized protein n=1 Tax=Effrenium voratum TaxID=2562239 RepID=A0AA36IR72_9DINO|nr:unnamed protein product [Effrenium voratum]